MCLNVHLSAIKIPKLYLVKHLEKKKEVSRCLNKGFYVKKKKKKVR